MNTQHGHLVAPLIHKARDEVASVLRKLEPVEYDADTKTMVLHCDEVVDGTLGFASDKDRLVETIISPSTIRTDYADVGDLFVTGSALIEDLHVRSLMIGDDADDKLDLSSVMQAAQHQRLSEDGETTIFEKDLEVRGELRTTSLHVEGEAVKNSPCWSYPAGDKLMTDVRDADLDCCYSVVRELPLKSFTWRDVDAHQMGFRASDVKDFFPKAVDEDGVDTGQVYVSLFGAVQKLMDMLEQLSSRIHRLEQQISTSA